MSESQSYDDVALEHDRRAGRCRPGVGGVPSVCYPHQQQRMGGCRVDRLGGSEHDEVTVATALTEEIPSVCYPRHMRRPQAYQVAAPAMQAHRRHRGVGYMGGGPQQLHRHEPPPPHAYTPHAMPVREVYDEAPTAYSEAVPAPYATPYTRAVPGPGSRHPYGPGPGYGYHRGGGGPGPGYHQRHPYQPPPPPRHHGHSPYERGPSQAYYDDDEPTDSQYDWDEEPTEVELEYETFEEPTPSASRNRMKWRRKSVELMPGVDIALHGSEETEAALENGRVRKVYCIECDKELLCVNKATMIICPACRSISHTGAPKTDLDDSCRGEDTLGLGVEVGGSLLER